jgi:hypothetical protein
MTPDDGLNGAAQVVVLGFAARTDCLDERREPPPMRVRQHVRPVLARHRQQVGIELKS